MHPMYLKLPHELTFATVQVNLMHLLKKFKEPGDAQLLLDLHDVVHCDSAGLAFLIEAKKLGQQYQKTLQIEDVPQHIIALAEFCGVKALLTQG